MSRALSWRRFATALPMRTALTGVALVWLLGCVWSFEEQTNFAAAKGFTLPWLLPLVIDGLAAAMAGVAYAASLDARPAIPARIATALAVGASAASNAAWAWERAGDPGTVALAVAIPIAANLAFEVLLSEMRRQVQRGRGQQPPVAVPYPRVIRLLLAPASTFVTWRRTVLALTAIPDTTPARGAFGAGSDAAGLTGEAAEEPGLSPWWQTAPPAATATNGRDRAAQLIAAGVGRRRLARELGTTEHEARQLLQRVRRDEARQAGTGDRS
jgi:hypothetical protein